MKVRFLPVFFTLIVFFFSGVCAQDQLQQAAQENKDLAYEQFPEALNVIVDNLQASAKEVLIKKLQKLKADSYDSVTIYKGKLPIFGQDVPAFIRQDEDGFSYTIPLPKTWSFATIFPLLKPLDSLSFSEAAFIISDHEYEVTEQDLPFLKGFSEETVIQQGFNFIGKVKLVGPLKQLAPLVKADEIIVHGLFTSTGEGSSFEAFIPGTISFAGDRVIAREPKLLIEYTDAPEYTLESQLDFTMPLVKKPLTFISKLSITPDGGQLSGVLEGVDWKNPLGLRGVTFTSVTLNADYADGSLSSIDITGDTITDGEVAGQFSIKTEGDLTSDEYAFVITLPEKLDLSRLPGLRVLKGINVTNTLFIYSTYEYEDQETGKIVKPGLNFGATLPLTGPLTAVKELTKADTVSVAGVLSDKPEDTSFKAVVPGKVSFGPVGMAENFVLDITQSEDGSPTYSLKNKLSLRVPLEKNPLVFDSSFVLGKDEVTVAGKMKETWSNPFGIPGLTFKNIGLAGSLDYREKKLTDLSMDGDVYASPKAGSFGIDIKGNLLSDKHSFVISLPATVKLSQKLPGLAALEGLSVTEPKLVYSTWAYEDKDLNISVKKGLNFAGRIQFTGPLKAVGDAINQKEAIVAGAVSKKDKATSFSVNLPGTMSLGSVAQARNLTLSLQKEAGKKPTFSLINDLKVTIEIEGKKITFDTSSTFTLGANTASVKGKVKNAWKDPFMLKGVTFRNLELSASFDYKERKLKDIDFDGEIVTGSSVMAGNFEIKGEPFDQYSVVMHLPSKINIGSLVPPLKVLKDFSISKPMLVYSTWSYEDEQLDAAIKPGFNFVGTIQFTGPLAVVKKITKAKEITLAGNVPNRAIGSTFTALIPGEISFGKAGKAQDLRLRLAFEATGPQVGIESALKLKFPHVDLPKMSGFIQLGTKAGSIQGKLDQPLRNLFGVKGLSIDNLELLKTTFTYSAPPVITNFGFSGALKMGQGSVAVAGAAGIGQSITLVGKLGNISLSSLLSKLHFVTKLDKNNVMKKIPDLSLKNAEVYLVPEPVTIGGRRLDKGLSIKGAATLFGQDINLVLQVEGSSITGSADLEAINAGVLHITGTGGGNSKPTVRLKIGPTDAQLYVDGMLKLERILGGISSKTRIEFSPPDRMSAQMSAKFSDAFAFNVTIGGSGIIHTIPTNLFIDAEIQQNAIAVLKKEITKGLKKVFGKKKALREAAKESANACTVLAN